MFDLKVLLFLLLLFLAQTIFSQQLPDDFPEIEILEIDNPAPGNTFFSTYGYPHLYPDAVPYLIIIDNQGLPVFYKKMPSRCFDFKCQPNGNLTYHIIENGNSIFYELNKQFEIVDHYQTGNGFYTDNHELRVLPNGNAFLLAYQYVFIDMDTVIPGGQPHATVGGLIVQEIDTAKQVVFEWQSWDHFEITDAHDSIDLTSDYIDYCHGNAIEIDSDTSIIISSRNMCEVTKIDRRTGEIIWRWGGRHNEFEFINDTLGFSYQHHIRLLENGNFSLFDNGNYHPTPFSSACEYELDQINKTATLINRIRNTPDIYGGFLGSAQKLENGGFFVGWGSGAPNITEYHPDGSIALQLNYPAVSYRAFKFNWEHTVFYSLKDTLVFVETAPFDTISSTVPVYNNTRNAISITSVHHQNVNFIVDETFPLNIPAFDTIFFKIQFTPDSCVEYRDLLTLFNDISSDTLVQRISCQVYLSGTGSDDVVPEVNILPDSGSIEITTDTSILITFSEKMYKPDGSPVSGNDLSSLLTIRENDYNGTPVSFESLINENSDSILITPVNLKYNQRYYCELYKDSLADYCGNAINGSCITVFTTKSDFGMNDFMDQSISIYPNPGMGLYTLVFSSRETKIIEVYDFSGKLIASAKTGNQLKYQFDLTNQIPGLYLVNIVFKDGKSAARKIISR